MTLKVDHIGFLALTSLLMLSCSGRNEEPAVVELTWLAGDHHVHSKHSIRWDESVDPPVTIPAPDGGPHSVLEKARFAEQFGLDWIVSTDHGGRAHAEISLEQTYPDLMASRRAFPDLIQYFGIELNTPGGDHNTVIVPHSPDEAKALYEIESIYDRFEYGQEAPDRDTTALMIQFLEESQGAELKPVVIANHPSLSASSRSLDDGLLTPEEMRKWNDAAPDVAIGMEGSPGHQAATIDPYGKPIGDGARGLYTKQPTLGGFDPMTAIVGGVWDSLLSEGRRWWITASSDSHSHWSEGGVDFWPGEFSKTYVYAEKSYSGILEGIRRGRVFVVAGDLISELHVEISTDSGVSVGIGDSIKISKGDYIDVTVQVIDPDTNNHNGDNPSVERIDLVTGAFSSEEKIGDLNSNSTAGIVHRFSNANWEVSGTSIVATTRLGPVDSNMYVRVRGTNSIEKELFPDRLGEDPWSDLWFYSNPIFVSVE